MLALFKGAGEFGSAAARRLFLMGFQIVLTELPQPLCVRRKVSFAECVAVGTAEVDSIPGKLASSSDEIHKILEQSLVAVVIDPQNAVTAQLQPTIVVDARMLKTFTDTSIDEADVVIGLGPGFVAGEQVHAVIETNRGHNLGRVIYHGMAEPDTKTPSAIQGHTISRVLRAPAGGQFIASRDIGNHVEVGDVIGMVGVHPIKTQLSGVIRGLILSGIEVEPGTKVGDIDPRDIRDYCFTVSDKANAIAGGVVEACFNLLRRRNNHSPILP